MEKIKAHAFEYAIKGDKEQGEKAVTMLEDFLNTLVFIDTDDYNVEEAGNVGHGFEGVYNTGSQSTDQSKNIYDLEGNVNTWTTEAYVTYLRIYRGGHYDRSSSASYRLGYYPNSSYDDLGSMCQLYVK